MKRYSEALAYAANLHQDQTRKGTTVPYISHLMHVSAYVLEFGGNEDQAIAGLLHDAIEDQADKTSLDEIRTKFGNEVARIVAACTDADTVPKPAWEERKQAYLDGLRKKDNLIKLVVACDKLHNAQSIVRDVGLYGRAYLDRFNAKPDRQLWYYQSLVSALEGLDSPVVRLLREEVNVMKELINESL
jgi:(p)ppGpp synthase/HD superfamily hydrolase